MLQCTAMDMLVYRLLHAAVDFMSNDVGATIAGQCILLFLLLDQCQAMLCLPCLNVDSCNL